MKRTIALSVLLLLTLLSHVNAQETQSQENRLRVAVFDPTISGNIFDEGAGVIIRELVSSALVNTGKFIIIERSLLDKILKEQKFSQSGAVDDSQISQLGKLAGANKVILSVLSSAGNKGLLSIKLIDVESASIEGQKTELVEQSKIYDNITALTLEMVGEKVVRAAKKTDDENQRSWKPRTLNFGGLIKVVTSKDSQNDNDAKDMDNDKAMSSSSTDNTPIQDGILLTFKGFKYKKNPEAQIFVDGIFIGSGTLNKGFSLTFPDDRPGRYQIKIEWSGTIEPKEFEINTQKKKRFEFEYARTGFGYDFQLKK